MMMMMMVVVVVVVTTMTTTMISKFSNWISGPKQDRQTSNLCIPNFSAIRN